MAAPAQAFDLSKKKQFATENTEVTEKSGLAGMSDMSLNSQNQGVDVLIELI